ncbi:riboflavin synthase [Actinomadura viridis]|uniref:Riboflavin synthase n=1 Tax=Actinomadura viridis TaxID=58110 RepID=A0A931DFL9_9ACTN|nr:riboflavin synthase [Actinomadura viridis]MBG6088342.1 riboflavin synthase [Actinomadura viridis]
MFTGIVEELGEIVGIESAGDSAKLTIHGPLVTQDAVHGASIAVNGVCLTVVDVKDETFTADAVKETLDRSALGALGPGARVNLERPVRLQDRLGGHLVQGHVDGVGRVVSREPGERWELVTVSLPPGLSRYVVDKGSITVDGISLTVVEAGDDAFSVALIPTTLALTTLGHKAPGDPVNLEVDVVAKYVERMLGARAAEPAPETAGPAGGVS